MQDEKGRWKRRVAFDKREKKITDINWKGHPEINLLLGTGPWVGKVSHSPFKDGDSTIFPSLLFTLGKDCCLMYNSLFMCCGHCHSVMIWHSQKDINRVIFVTMLKIVKEREKVTHISIAFKGLSEFVLMFSWFCSSLPFQVWLSCLYSQGISGSA